MASIGFPKSVTRLGEFPLDDSSVFTTQVELDAYIASPVCYAGQLLSLVDVATDTVKAFKVNIDKSITEIGKDIQPEWEVLP